MKQIVIDHNILFAAIHTKTSYTRRRLLESPFRFYKPYYLIVEKSKATEGEVLSVFDTKSRSRSSRVLGRLLVYAET